MSTKDTEWPTVGIVIVNWNNYEDTAECLTNLESLSYPDYRVVVVDNGSTDGSGDRLAAVYDWCTFVFTDRNLGFGGGCNAGIEQALDIGCEYVLLLNNDAEPRPGALEELVRVATLSDSGIVGAMVTNESGSPVTVGRNRYPDMLFYSGYRGNLPLAAGNREALTGRRWWRTDRIEGAAVLLSRSLLRERAETMGYYLDDSLFMYCEEVELSLWCRRHGWEAVIAENATVVHDGGNSSDRAFQLYYLTRNRVLVMHRYLEGVSFLLFVTLSLFWRLALAGRYFKRGQERIAAAILRGLYDGVRGIDGKSEEPY